MAFHVSTKVQTHHWPYSFNTKAHKPKVQMKQILERILISSHHLQTRRRACRQHGSSNCSNHLNSGRCGSIRAGNILFVVGTLQIHRDSIISVWLPISAAPILCLLDAVEIHIFLCNRI